MQTYSAIYVTVTDLLEDLPAIREAFECADIGVSYGDALHTLIMPTTLLSTLKNDCGDLDPDMVAIVEKRVKELPDYCLVDLET